VRRVAAQWRLRADLDEERSGARTTIIGPVRPGGLAVESVTTPGGARHLMSLWASVLILSVV
jgi:hypothetical protein